MKNALVSSLLTLTIIASGVGVEAHEKEKMKCPCPKMMKSCPQMMMKSLGEADKNYDLRFIDAMTVHHQQAVDMAKDALQKAQHPEIKQMAQNIINAQEKEIAQLKTWRQQWYGK
ncbi:MAG: DUF305 domain-containing protein [Cyanobacteria bacterium]|nr:DUF305 domain-containing protein [Cyanobacteriota bacterium]